MPESSFICSTCGCPTDTKYDIHCQCRCHKKHEEIED